MSNREAAGTLLDQALPLHDAERLLLESSENHYLRPASSLVGRLCRATLTTERLILREAHYDLAAAKDKHAGSPIHEVQLTSIERIVRGPDTDEPFLELDVRNARRELEKLILWFRDAGWAVGVPQRLTERDQWLDTITREKQQGGQPVASATRRVGSPKSASANPAARGVTRVLAGTFEIVRQIGEGGMGLVYLGRDRKLDRPVAIKQMRSDLRLNARERAQFLEEARLSAALHHPFIVDVYAILEEGSEIFLVFEYVDGKTLEEQLHEHGPMTADALTKPLEHVCAALSYAHGCKVVHRDLKPSNIMLTSHGFAKVMDFGIARQMKDSASRVSATSVDSSGTVPYMAPEQELGRSDVRSDIFSLGATIYELLTASLPFAGPNFYLQKEKGALTPLLERAPGTPRNLAAAVEKSMRFDPRDRFQTIAEFVEAIGVH